MSAPLFSKEYCIKVLKKITNDNRAIANDQHLPARERADFENTVTLFDAILYYLEREQ